MTDYMHKADGNGFFVVCRIGVLLNW